MSRHHAESFREGREPFVRWGWQCLTCSQEAYVATLSDAERGAEAHENNLQASEGHGVA